MVAPLNNLAPPDSYCRYKLLEFILHQSLKSAVVSSSSLSEDEVHRLRRRENDCPDLICYGSDITPVERD